MLGMNVHHKCYQELFMQHGPALFELPPVANAPKLVTQGLQKCHHASVLAPQDKLGTVRVRGRKAHRISCCIMKMVATTCSEQYSGATVLFEPCDTGLPAGLLASPSLVKVDRATAYIPVIKVGFSEVLLYPHTIVGTLDSVHVVSLPAGITVAPSPLVIESCQICSPFVQEQTEDLDLSLSSAEQQKVRTVLGKYTSVFSAYDTDLGTLSLC